MARLEFRELLSTTFIVVVVVRHFILDHILGVCAVFDTDDTHTHISDPNGVHRFVLNMEIQLLNSIHLELKREMGAEHSIQKKSSLSSTTTPMPKVKKLRVRPIRTCNHCVECCWNSEVASEGCQCQVSLDYMRTFRHHAMPNVPKQASIRGVTKKPASHRFDYVDEHPSALRAKRRLPLLSFLELPQSYTNIPDFYSELLVVQYEMKRQSMQKISSAASCTHRFVEDENGSIALVDRECTSRFRCEEIIQKACAGSLKRPYEELLGKQDTGGSNYEALTSMSSSSLSTEFSFDGLDETKTKHPHDVVPNQSARLFEKYKELGVAINW